MCRGESFQIQQKNLKYIDSILTEFFYNWVGKTLNSSFNNPD